jgi:putative transport protein
VAVTSALRPATIGIVVGFLADNPLVVLFACLALGSAVGSIRLRGFTLGPAAVLFAALALSAWDSRLELPVIVGSLGLAIFAYCIGIASGPSFFGAVRHNLGAVAAVVALLVASAAVARVVGKWLGLPGDVIAGIYAGGLTNTPALAAATERIGGGAGPTVGYSVTYIGGVLVMLAVTAWVLRPSAPAAAGVEDGAAPPLIARTLSVERPDLPTLGDLAQSTEHPVVFTRIKHDGALEVARDDMQLEPGDLVSAVGHPDDVAAISERVGGLSDEKLTLDRRSLDMRRIAMSTRRLSGRTVAELGLERFGARATRVRRGDVDLIVRPEMRVHQGDRIRVIAPRHNLPEVARYLGDSERGPGDLNPVGLSIGLALGLLLGLVPLPSPAGGTFTIGVAAGPLVAGLILGRASRTGPVSWSLPYAASQLLQQLGILIFLAVAGSRAGGNLVDALHSEQGLRIAAAGFVVTGAFALALVVLARAVGLHGPRAAGLVAGAQTQPAVLAFAQERTGNDPRVDLGYALVFPAAMITKIIIAAGLVTLG